MCITKESLKKEARLSNVDRNAMNKFTSSVIMMENKEQII